MPGRSVSRLGGAPRNTCLRIKLSGLDQQHQEQQQMRSDGAYFRRQQSDSCGQPNTSASSWSPWHSWQQEDLHPWQQEQSRPQQVARSAHSEGGVSAPPLPLEPRQFDSAAAAEHVFLSPETTAMMQRHERVVEASARPPVQTQLPPWRLSSRGAGLVTPPMPPAASQRWRQQQQQEHQSSAGSAMPPKPLPTTSRLQHEQLRSAQPPPSPALSDMDLGTPLPPARNGSGHATLASARAAALIPWKQNQQRVVEGAVAPAAAPHSQQAEPAQAWAGDQQLVALCPQLQEQAHPNRPSPPPKSTKCVLSGALHSSSSKIWPSAGSAPAATPCPPPPPLPPSGAPQPGPTPVLPLPDSNPPALSIPPPLPPATAPPTLPLDTPPPPVPPDQPAPGGHDCSPVVPEFIRQLWRQQGAPAKAHGTSVAAKGVHTVASAAASPTPAGAQQAAAAECKPAPVQQQQQQGSDVEEGEIVCRESSASAPCTAPLPPRKPSPARAPAPPPSSCSAALTSQSEVASQSRQHGGGSRGRRRGSSRGRQSSRGTRQRRERSFSSSSGGSPASSRSSSRSGSSSRSCSASSSRSRSRSSSGGSRECKFGQKQRPFRSGRPHRRKGGSRSRRRRSVSPLRHVGIGKHGGKRRHAAPAAPAGALEAQLKLASMVDAVAAEYASLQQQLSRQGPGASRVEADAPTNVKRQLDALASQLGQLSLCVQQQQQLAHAAVQSAKEASIKESKEHSGVTYLCFDTNVWIDHAGLIRDCFKQLRDSGCPSIRILVPLAVLRELDSLKKCLFRGFWARWAIKKLAKCQAEGHPALRGQREDELHRGLLRRNDDGILDCMLFFRARGAQVRFASKDLQMVVRARNEGFPCCTGEVARQWLSQQAQAAAAAGAPPQYPKPPQRR